MKNNVFLSFEISDGSRCVDIFERPDGSFGYEEFRRDVEDQGVWQSLAKFSQRTFANERAVLVAAHGSVSWLHGEPAWENYRKKNLAL